MGVRNPGAEHQRLDPAEVRDRQVGKLDTIRSGTPALRILVPGQDPCAPGRQRLGGDTT